jgi:hypothetical protein
VGKTIFIERGAAKQYENSSEKFAGFPLARWNDDPFLSSYPISFELAIPQKPVFDCLQGQLRVD